MIALSATVTDEPSLLLPMIEIIMGLLSFVTEKKHAGNQRMRRTVKWRLNIYVFFFDGLLASLEVERLSAVLIEKCLFC